MTDPNKHKIAPRRVSIDSPGTGMPGFERRTTEIPAKIVSNTRNSMDVLDMYLHGPLQWKNIGDVCGNCVNFAPDPSLEVSTSQRTRLDSEHKEEVTRTKSKIPRHHGRCKAKGFLVVHEETAADERKNYNHPDGVNFPLWPACPYYLSASRLSKR